MIGRTLGPYRIIEKIGAGGMGEVYRARDTRLDRDVAIKTLHSSAAADRDRVRRFEHEARAIAALNHPHICHIYDVLVDPDDPDRHYLVLEYVQGVPLAGPLTPDETLRIAVQVAGALDAAHRSGILHRDLKPANILVSGAGPEGPTAKLLDFGLAKTAAAASDATLTAEGIVAGTPAYMSPEQAQGRPLDARSDIFSFGAVLYEVLSGCRPFEGNSSAEVLSAVLRDDPPPLDIPRLGAIVRRCLEKDPSRRFASVSALRAALEDSQDVADRPASIAVLPFANLSADKENEYFSDGLAEEIINALTRIRGLKVTARTSAFAFRGKEQDIRGIAETLDVSTILEGSVRRSGNRIRVAAQLINAVDGYHLWSDRFDRELADVFEVQDEIADAIASALRVTLGRPETPAARRTPSMPSYEAYLRGVHESQKLTPDGLARSREWYDQAIALDPNFALAHGMSAFNYAQLANFGLLPAHEAMPLVRAAAKKALAIDPSLPEGHAMLGLVAALYDYDWVESAHCFARAMASEAGPSVRRQYAIFYLLPVGRAAEAAEECRRALVEDPLNLLGRVRYAQCLMATDRVDDALAELRRVLEMDEALWFTHFILGLEELRAGRHRPAIAFADRACTLAPWNPSAKGLLAAAYRRAGDEARADHVLESIRRGPAYGQPLALAVYHHGCANHDAAVEFTKAIIAERHPALFFFLRSHAYDLLKSPRWGELASALKLPVRDSDATV